MTTDEILERIRGLSENERRKLVRQILDEFTEFDDELTPEQITELERRAEELRKNPHSGIPAETVFTGIEKRLAHH
jgi:putative addiction module component (TIGR02574 family)